jgi:cytochrome b561
MTPRIVDWSLACATGIAFATGLLTLVSGRAESRWVFDVHAVAGYALLLLMLPKLVRVRRRLLPGGRDWRVWAGRGAAVFGTAVVLSGALWALGAPGVWLGYNLLNWHIIGGFVLTAIMSLHMVLRARPLRRSDLAERRSLLRLGAVSLAAIAALPLKERLSATAGWPGANRRFTGSREVASFTGNAFPTVSWVADRPQPIEREWWELRIGGMVARPAALRYVDLDRNEQLTEIARKAQEL